jgi:hypothetical protein
MIDAAAGSYPSSTPRPHAAARRAPGPLSFLIARAGAPWLDRRLAAGVAQWHSPLHAARAVQITGARRRRRLARSLEALAERAEMPHNMFLHSSVVEPCREQVREALPQILMLTIDLRGARPVRARGVAALHRVITDGGGPCYVRSDRAALARALEQVSQWLDIQE